MRRAPVVILLVAVVAVVAAVAGGCSQKPEKELEQVEQSLAAWSSTLQLAGEDREHGAVPRLYVDRLVKAAGKQLDKQRKQLSKISPDNPKRRELDQRLARVREQTQTLKNGGGGGPAS